jgi:TatA/E family protein of Tat protein translocase
MFGLGWGELLIILFIVLVLFGARKLPGLANSLGASVGEFKKGLRGGQPQDDNDGKTIEAGTATADHAVPKQETKT